MIVSRIRKHIHEQNTPALFLEFFVLVLGFLVSLQINDWENARSDRELELEYLERIQLDLDGSHVAVEKDIQNLARSIEKLDYAIRILSADKLKDGDHERLFEAAASGGIMGSFAVIFGTFEELKDTGNMRLIRSTELRVQLANMWQHYNLVLRLTEIRNILRGNAFPIMVQFLKPQENGMTFDASMIAEKRRELFVALTIIRSNLNYDLKDSENLLEMIKTNQALVRPEIRSKM